MTTPTATLDDRTTELEGIANGLDLVIETFKAGTLTPVELDAALSELHHELVDVKNAIRRESGWGGRHPGRPS